MKTANYIPKPARGVSYPGHLRITRRQLSRLFENPDFRFSGFIVGNRVHPFHYFGGWYLACPLENRTAEEMRDSLVSFEWHLDRELGTRAAVFVSKAAISPATV